MKFASTFVLIASTLSMVGCSGSTTAAPTAPTGLTGTPSVTTAPWTAAPAHGADLKVSCTTSAGASSDTCPVITWGGITFWAFSYVDNRGSLAIVAYNAAGTAVGTLDRPGTRYVAQITVDAVTQTVKLQGQGAATVSATWDELRALGK